MTPILKVIELGPTRMIQFQISTGDLEQYDTRRNKTERRNEMNWLLMTDLKRVPEEKGFMIGSVS